MYGSVIEYYYWKPAQYYERVGNCSANLTDIMSGREIKKEGEHEMPQSDKDNNTIATLITVRKKCGM